MQGRVSLFPPTFLLLCFSSLHSAESNYVEELTLLLTSTIVILRIHNISWQENPQLVLLNQLIMQTSVTCGLHYALVIGVPVGGDQLSCRTVRESGCLLPTQLDLQRPEILMHVYLGSLPESPLC